MFDKIPRIVLRAVFTAGLIVCLTGHAVIGEEMRLGISNFEPLAFMDSEGEPRGIFIDVLNFIAETEEWKIVPVPGSWEQSLDRLKKGEIDLLAGIAYTEERSGYLDFTDEYLFLDWGVVYRKKGMKISNIMDLSGKKTGVLRGGIYTEEFKKLLNQFGVRARLIEKSDNRQIFSSIASGETDAGVSSQLYGMQLEGLFNIEKTQIYFSPVKYRFAVKKGSHQEVLKKLNSSLVSLKSDFDSIYHSSLNRWVGNYHEQKPIPEWLKWLLALAVCVFFMILIFSIVMKKQVDLRTAELRIAIQELREMNERRSQESDEKMRIETLLERELEFHREISALKDRVIDRSIDLARLREATSHLAINITESRFCCITEALEKGGGQVTHTVENLTAGDGGHTRENYTRMLTADDEARYRAVWEPWLGADRPRFSNDAGNGGGPAGDLGRILVVPSLVRGRCMGRIILAGSSRDYTSSDLDHIEMLAALYGLAAYGIRNEQA